MRERRVIYTPEAEAQLVGLLRFIANATSVQRARTFTDEIVSRCENLSMLPDRGAPRGDVRPGLRTLSFRRVVIAYAVDETMVTVVGVFYGGQDFESILRDG